MDYNNLAGKYYRCVFFLHVEVEKGRGAGFIRFSHPVLQAAFPRGLCSTPCLLARGYVSFRPSRSPLVTIVSFWLKRRMRR